MIVIEFDQSHSLRSGEVIQATKGWVNNQNHIRASVIVNVSSNQEIERPFGLMTSPPMVIDPPVTGRIIGTKYIGQNKMEIYLEEGTITEDFVFIKSGEVKKGVDGLVSILKSIKKYLKICDPYINLQTISLLESCFPEVRITILTRDIDDLTDIKTKISDLKLKRIFVNIRKVSANSLSLHGRYIISESGAWSIDSSLKEIGRSDTLILPIPDKIQTEFNFDERYVSEGKKI